MPSVAAPSDAYREYARLLARLHALIRADADDSPEGEAIRDEMDVHWQRLNQGEIERLSLLSLDHYAISEAPAFLDGWATDQDFRPEILQAASEEDWPRLRSLLTDRSHHVDGTDSALFRGFYWAAHGDLEPSLEFLRSLLPRFDSARASLETMQAIRERRLEITRADPEHVADIRELGRAVIGLVDWTIEEVNDMMRTIQTAIGAPESSGLDAGRWPALKGQFLRIKPILSIRAA